LEPFHGRIALNLGTEFEDVASQFLPGLHDRATKGVIHQLKIDLPAINQHPQSFPGAQNHVDRNKLIGRQVIDGGLAGIVGQVKDVEQTSDKVTVWKELSITIASRFLAADTADVLIPKTMPIIMIAVL
jgi:hypothetical protein